MEDERAFGDVAASLETTGDHGCRTGARSGTERRPPPRHPKMPSQLPGATAGRRAGDRGRTGDVEPGKLSRPLCGKGFSAAVAEYDCDAHGRWRVHKVRPSRVASEIPEQEGQPLARRHHDLSDAEGIRSSFHRRLSGSVFCNAYETGIKAVSSAYSE